MAAWTYHAALLAFRREGDSVSARARLRQAMKGNPHVPAMLANPSAVPRSESPYIGFGDETEAAAYVRSSWLLWTRTEGALAWLRSRR